MNSKEIIVRIFIFYDVRQFDVCIQLSGYQQPGMNAVLNVYNVKKVRNV